MRDGEVLHPQASGLLQMMRHLISSSQRAIQIRLILEESKPETSKSASPDGNGIQLFSHLPELGSNLDAALASLDVKANLAVALAS
ncbi:hypothetical protein SLA2020_014880 [Shorea laevis]